VFLFDIEPCLSYPDNIGAKRELRTGSFYKIFLVLIVKKIFRKHSPFHIEGNFSFSETKAPLGVWGFNLKNYGTSGI